MHQKRLDKQGTESKLSHFVDVSYTIGHGKKNPNYSC